MVKSSLNHYSIQWAANRAANTNFDSLLIKSFESVMDLQTFTFQLFVKSEIHIFSWTYELAFDFEGIDININSFLVLIESQKSHRVPKIWPNTKNYNQYPTSQIFI